MKILFINNDGGGFRRHHRNPRRHDRTAAVQSADRCGQGSQLFDPGQPPTGGPRPGVARGGPGLDHAHQDRRRAGMSDKQARRVVAARPDRRGRRRLRDRVRHAQWIHQSLAHAGRRVNVPTISLHNLDRLTRQQRHAAGKGWLAAQAKLESRMLNVLAAIRVQTEDAISALQPARPASRATVQEITDDLAALEADFAGVKLHPRSHTLSVTTEPIELSGVYLGPFEIQLDLRRLDQSCAYHVIAKDPHPAATSESSTHPHVCDDRLCEGEGYAAIRRALADGRLFDFFVIVRQVLNTYNPDSAYISLADWDGIECQDCGDTVEFSDSDCCSRCDGRMCRDAVACVMAARSPIAMTASRVVTAVIPVFVAAA